MSEKLDYVLFSEVYNGNDIQEEILKKAYYLGAYSKAIIDNSFYSTVSRGNRTFKTWLSNQIINAKNLNRIFDKATTFENKLKLGGNRLQDLSTQVTSCSDDSSKNISKYTISFYFRKGFNEYVQFKEEQKEHDDKVEAHNKKLQEQNNG
jgi:hypothetical protein